MRIATALTESLYRNGHIDLDEKEIIHYGLSHMELNLYSLFVTLSVGVLFGKLFVALLLFLLLFPLRKNAGGFHAETRQRCFIISSLIVVLAFFLFDIMKWSRNNLCFIIILSYIVIYYMAPVACLNKPLDISEEKVYRKRTRIILALEGTLVPWAYYLDSVDVLHGISMSCSIAAILLIAGRIKLAITNKVDKNTWD